MKKAPAIPPALWIVGAVVAGKLILDYLATQADTTSSDPSILGTRTSQVMGDFATILKPTADDIQNKTGISSRLGLVQAALESSYGSSQLSRPDAKLDLRNSFYTVGPAFNIFGFKCGDAWIAAKRPYVLVPTKDYYKAGQMMPNGERATQDGQALVWPAPFRAYNSWAESYQDWARLMQTPKYQADGALAALQADDLQKFGIAMSKRYAPNQDYATRLSDRAAEMGVA